jgi:acyl dehydratase
MRSFASLTEFAAARGEHLGFSPWREVAQRQVDMFADATTGEDRPACVADTLSLYVS